MQLCCITGSNNVLPSIMFIVVNNIVVSELGVTMLNNTGKLEPANIGISVLIDDIHLFRGNPTLNTLGYIISRYPKVEVVYVNLEPLKIFQQRSFFVLFLFCITLFFLCFLHPTNDAIKLCRHIFAPALCKRSLKVGGGHFLGFVNGNCYCYLLNCGR